MNTLSYAQGGAALTKAQHTPTPLTDAVWKRHETGNCFAAMHSHAERLERENAANRRTIQALTEALEELEEAGRFGGARADRVHQKARAALQLAKEDKQ